MADVILVEKFSKLFGNDTLFICTEDHAIEVSNIDGDVLENIETQVKKCGAEFSESNSYSRAFRFSLKKETEYFYTTKKGIGHYYKKGWKKSEFCYLPWDSIRVAVKSKGCLKKNMMIIADTPVISKCKFPASTVGEIIAYLRDNVKDNAGSGNMYGKGSNKVLVTDTHVICIGKKDFKALPKPYDDGKLIKKSWCSSRVDIDGFEVRVGRYAWKGFCCGTGPFYKAVTESPSREIKGDAEKHRF